MRYFVYLRRSFTRAWRAHVLLILLLSCAISLPLGLSILYASYQHGDALRAEFVSGGHHIGIHNAKPGDEAYFADLQGGSAVWEDGKLYIDRDPDNPKVVFDDENYSAGDPLHTDVRMRAEESPNSLIVEYYENYFGDNAGYVIPDAFFSVALVFSNAILCFALGAYWHRNGGEMRKLQSIGASGRQIFMLSYVHMLVVQILASLLAAMMSTGFLYTLTKRFLTLFMTGTQRHASSSNFWLAFHVNPTQMLLFIGIAFATSTVFFLLWHTASMCIYTLSLRQRQLRPLVKLRFHGRIQSVLRRTFLRRGTLLLFFGVLAAIPLVAASVLFFQLREDPEKAAAIYSDEKIRIGVDRRFFPGFTMESLTYFENLEGVARVEPSIVHATYEYYISDSRSRSEKSNRYHGDTYGFQVELIPSEDANPEGAIDEGNENLYKVLYDPGTSGATYAAGTVLTLYTFAEKTVHVQIVDVLDADAAYEKRLAYYNGDEEAAKGWPGEVYMYCSGADLREITEYEYCSTFFLYLTHVSYNQSVEDAIFAYFTPEQLGLYLNNYTDKEVAYNRAVGMNLLYTTLSLLLFAFFAVITTLSLIDYAASHRETLRFLHMQGASHRSIVLAFVEIMLPPAILTCAAVWAIVTPVEREYYRLRGYTDALMAKMDLRMIDDPRYLLAALAVVAVFVLPVVGTVVRELRRLDRG